MTRPRRRARLTLSDYDGAYSRTAALFGLEPERALVRWAAEIPAGAPALDIGAGQGRNALFLARRGVEVVALDPSAVACETVGAAAARDGLPCRAFREGFEEHWAPAATYGAVLAFGLVQVLTRPRIGALVDRVTSWARPGGLVFVTAFYTADEGYRERASTWRSIGKGSLVDEDGEVRTYLEPGEVLELFAGLEVVHHEEALGPVHRHGDSPPERHAMVEAVFRKL